MAVWLAGLVALLAMPAVASDVAPSLVNGRPTLTSADGAFSASLRSLVQFDMGYYDQAAPPRAPQLSNGSDFRRARIGIDGKVYTDWEYSFIYDFGGSGVEGSSISAAYVQYNGLNPLLLRLGAFAPYANVGDSSGSSDLMFLERATVTEIQRGLSSSPDSKIVVGLNGTSIFQPAGVNPPPGVALSLGNPPELRVDDTGTNGAPTNLISTGNLNANSLTQWGVDGAANYKNFYTEGGYYSYINNAIKTQLSYQYVTVDRLNVAGQSLNQDIDQISMRLQFAF